VGGGRSKNSIFAVLEYHSTILRTVYSTGNSFTPNQWYRWKAETLKVCLLLVWRVCDRHLADIGPGGCRKVVT